MKKIALLLFVSIGLAGCLTTEEYAERRAAPYEAWLGHTELELVRVWGVPDRSYQTGGIKFLAFVKQTVVNTPGRAAFPPPPAVPTIPATAPSVEIFTCTTTFEVSAGRIVSWSINGDRCVPPPSPLA
ncbi:MAG: hypothetical protein ACTSWI_01145 [Alphaproteobacteria bacterium]